ncbi:hypothetical protein ACRQ4B_05585 [Curtobacterium sp. SP.BCo]|uniref:hypothetical protein n=1 Tax=Curtobacterium sp. SP.BCo TaxID=3435229 RepID=UPI003F7356BE
MSTTFDHRHDAELTVDTATIAAITEIEASVVVDDEVVAVDEPSHARITWARPDTGLWAANYGGYYGGTVDRQGTHYFVSDTFGQYVGDFRSLEEAQQRLAERLHVLLPDVRRVDD